MYLYVFSSNLINTIGIIEVNKTISSIWIGEISFLNGGSDIRSYTFLNIARKTKF